MDKTLILNKLHLITGDLKPGTGGASQLDEFERLLGQQLIRDPNFTISGNFLPTEGARPTRTSAELVSRFSHLDDLFESTSAVELEEPLPLVFRRDTAFRNTLLGNSVPTWGSGLAATRSFGPFIDEHGLETWFDFFQPTRLVQLSIQGSSGTALSFPLWGSLTPKTSYRIEPGSAWIASNLIVRTSALKGYFTGLRVRGGSVELSQAPTITAGTISVAPTTIVSIHLDLEQVTATDTATEAGLDASAAEVSLPRTFDLRFNAANSRTTAGNASCSVFDCGVQFAFANAAPVWVSTINQILVPYEVRSDLADPNRFEINSSVSNLCTVSGDALISTDSGWLLPAARISPNYLGVAAGTGALCVTVRNGLTANWKGLTGGSTKLVHPSIVVEPGLVSVLDLFAQNVYGKQKWILWQNANSKHHSEIILTFGKSFPVVFTSSVNNTEAIFYFCGHKASFDRPVDANGSPFRIQSKFAFAGVLQNGNLFRASLFDDDLSDGDPASVFERCSVILRNALFSCSLPSSLFLTGQLQNDEEIVKGVVALTHRNVLYLPTLPDPYVASYTPFLRDRGALNFGQLPVLLSAFVKWPDPAQVEAAEGEESDPSYVYYRFSPIDQSISAVLPDALDRRDEDVTTERGTRSFYNGVTTFNRPLVSGVVSENELSLLAPGSSASTTISRSSTATNLPRVGRMDSGKIRDAVQALDANPLLSHIRDKEKQVEETLRAAISNNERRSSTNPFAVSTSNTEAGRFVSSRGNRGVLFGPDAFMLLDVSSNADQMGVSLGNAIRVERDDNGDANLRSAGLLFGSAVPNDTGLELQILNMDVVATARYLRAVTLPQISWEPIFNIPLEIEGPPAADDLITVAPGVLVYDNDGIPTRIFSESPYPVPIAPVPVTRHFLKEFHDKEVPRQLHSVFTLPFALEAYAQFERKLKSPVDESAQLRFNRPHFEELLGGLQIKATAPKSTFTEQSPSFKGAIIQLEDYIKWFLFGLPITGSTLGRTVKTIFDEVFINEQPKVPLERIEFSGYGASIFSNWFNTAAAVADVSQVKFDVLVGRTAHEVIQVRSILYPWGVHVVRTITLMRSGNSYVFRSDSGWKAESDGFCDFTYKIDFGSGDVRTVSNPYIFHPGPVKGVSNVREIKDYPAGGTFTSSFSINESGLPILLSKPNLSDWLPLFNKLSSLDEQLPVVMQAVVFDADAHIQFVKSGGEADPSGDFRVLSRKMLGYVQLSPSKIVVPKKVFASLLKFQNGSLGGPVDCLLDIAKSKQTMRVDRVDVNPALDGGQEIFVNAARGTLILPQDGSWSMVKQKTDTGDVNPLEQGQSVPLIKRNSTSTYRISEPADVVQDNASKIHYGVLQSTGTQKLLFDVPQFEPNQLKLKSAETYFADAYKLLNSKSVFPNVANALELTNAEKEVEILGEGLMKMAERKLDLENLLPANYTYAFIDEPKILKIYAEYKTKSGTNGDLTLGINSAGALADKWKAALANMRIVVDLGPFPEVMWVDGNFDAGSGVKTKYDVPHLQFGPLLDPVIQILEVLSKLSGDDFDSGMDVGMSNSPDNWEYKFNCSKEIPVIKFPSPTQLTINPNPPLKLEAGLKVGFYFNQKMAIPTDVEQLVPSCGAYIDFYGRLEVQCFTLAIASVYGVGQVNLGITADTKSKISVHMKFGFGAEIVVGLPVVLNVTVLYVAEVTVSLGEAALDVGAMLLFKGSAEICGGLVAITIQIEAGGSVHHTFSPATTNIVAQVTFTVDVTVLWVIDIDHTETWQESRQIA